MDINKLSLTKKYMLFSLFCVYIITCVGIFFNWISLSDFFFHGNVYINDCNNIYEASEYKRTYKCEEQDKKVQALYPIILCSNFIMSAISGTFFDYFGPKITALFGHVCNIISWILIGLQKENSNIIIFGSIFLGLSSDCSFIPLLSLIYLFPRNHTIYTVILGCCASLSFSIPIFLDLFSKDGDEKSFQLVCFLYCFIILVPFFFILIIFLPWQHINYDTSNKKEQSFNNTLDQLKGYIISNKSLNLSFNNFSSAITEEHIDEDQEGGSSFGRWMYQESEKSKSKSKSKSESKSKSKSESKSKSKSESKSKSKSNTGPMIQQNEVNIINKYNMNDISCDNHNHNNNNNNYYYNGVNFNNNNNTINIMNKKNKSANIYSLEDMENNSNVLNVYKNNPLNISVKNMSQIIYTNSSMNSSHLVLRKSNDKLNDHMKYNTNDLISNMSNNNKINNYISDEKYYKDIYYIDHKNDNKQNGIKYNPRNDIKNGIKMENDIEMKKKKYIYSFIHISTLWKEIKIIFFSLKYLSICYYFTIYNLSLVNYNECAKLFFKNYEDIQNMLKIFGPLSVIPCALFGILIQKIHILILIFILLINSILMYVFALIKYKLFSYFSAFSYLIVTGCYTTQLYCYIQIMFPTNHFGKIAGTTSMISGLLSLLNIPIYNYYIVDYNNNDPTPFAYFVILLLLSTFPLLYLIYKRCQN
ncbi:transporter, putative [Plasmodium gaboni]|uniref:Transporter, putative n=1 Tax=Plasmodium gaboni TaxID=647221 RepID=A0ABY1UGN3_9APIC|nr:transporter, putative [Plasmodium gaboni]